MAEYKPYFDIDDFIGEEIDIRGWKIVFQEDYVQIDDMRIKYNEIAEISIYITSKDSKYISIVSPEGIIYMKTRGSKRFNILLSMFRVLLGRVGKIECINIEREIVTKKGGGYSVDIDF